MAGMDWFQWVLVAAFMFVTLFVMEFEKTVRRYLASLGEDTDDREYGYFDEVPDEDAETPVDAKVGEGIAKFGTTGAELRR